jgi:type III secretion protein U
MADKNDGGDKTERPTPKKLQDARKKGQVAKSKDLTSTVELLAWTALFLFATALAAREIAALFEAALTSITQPFANGAPALGALASRTLLAIIALALLPVAAIGLLSEYLQAGPVFSMDKLKPKLDNLNPVEGVKRMFSADNAVELVKALAKTVLLIAIGWFVLIGALPQLAKLIGLGAQHTTPSARAVAAALGELTRSVLIGTVAAFVLVALLDMVWQRHSFIKKMRMSRRDIRQEMKESEGDPYVKQQRQQAHMEWTQRNAQQAARQANVLVVNPTHVAIAIDYDRDDCPVPTVSAKGEDHVARAMRAAAEEAGVPIVRNIELAHDLLARGAVGAIVPADLFDIVAEVILWAREVRDHMASGTPALQSAPGEDLTRYPQADARTQTLD